jgi:hypothetical protein
VTLRSKIDLSLKVLSERRYREFFLQRRVVDLSEREARSDQIAARLPQSGCELTGELAATSADLKRNGFAMIADLVDPGQVAEMRAYFETETCSDPYRPERGRFVAPKTIPAGTHVAFFDTEQVARAPHAIRIANDPRLLAVVSDVLKAKPTIGALTAWWTAPAGDGSAEHAERFHRDVDDWRFIKLFLYLTDVDESAGPHVFVKGSHAVNAMTEIRRYDDADVEQRFGKDNIVRFTGSAGTAFLENTSGMHRGLPSTWKPRLIFQVLYSLRPTIYGPKAPILPLERTSGGPAIDPYVNRIYCKVG